jgi:hypothetical protein
MVGEEFDSGNAQTTEASRRNLFAAFIHSIDLQDRYLQWAVRSTLVGGVLTLIAWVWILSDKMAA